MVSFVATEQMGGTSTFQRFDGIGKDKHFGDNILHASLGVTIGIGKQGFDRKPFLKCWVMTVIILAFCMMEANSLKMILKDLRV